MWIKIENDGQLHALQANNPVVRFPINGEILDSFDGATSENVMPFVVHRNQQEFKFIELQMLPATAQHLGDLGLFDLVIHPFSKDYNKLIEEKCWWIHA